ncbi:MAG: transcription antitermination factor NusB [Acidobacteriota bacterium]
MKQKGKTQDLTPTEPRSVAVRLLRRISRRGEHIDLIFSDESFLRLDVRDRGLVTELIYGVLRSQGTLDYYILLLSRAPFQKLDEIILWILRLGLYQLEFMRIPERAAVHETVNLCRVFQKTSAGSLVNALLRRFLREKPPQPSGDSAEALAVRLSHPVWLVKRYLARQPLKEARAGLMLNNQVPLPALWVNIFKTSLADFCGRLEQEGIAFEIVPDLPNCLVVRYPAFSQHPLYREGYCFFMDAASQQVVYLADLQDRRRLGDFCAAPGGKSFLIASQMQQGSRLVCADFDSQRLEETRARANFYNIPGAASGLRSQASGLYFVHADLSRSAPFQDCFDFVLLDVPCSGLGTLRSNPDIRWKAREEDLDRFHAKQVAILANGFAALQPGGELIYSTCSTEPEENESVVREFLAQETRARKAAEPFKTPVEERPGDCFFAVRIRRANRF